MKNMHTVNIIQELYIERHTNKGKQERKANMLSFIYKSVFINTCIPL